jgi:hypothetical protein
LNSEYHASEEFGLLPPVHASRRALSRMEEIIR